MSGARPSSERRSRGWISVGSGTLITAAAGSGIEPYRSRRKSIQDGLATMSASAEGSHRRSFHSAQRFHQ